MAAEENVLSDHLPLKVKTIFEHKYPIYDDELLFLKRNKRKCERLNRKTRSVELKADFDLNTKVYLDNFLEKNARFINNVLHGKFKSQNYALLKALLNKEEQLPKSENKEILATNFKNSFVFFRNWEC